MALTSLVIKKGYVDSINVHQQLHYRYVLPGAGQRENAIVFMHKSASSSVSFELLMLHYANEGFPCYAIDMPGFGGSFDPDKAQEVEIEQTGTVWFAEILLQALKRLEVTRQKFHIIGHHSGASLATQIAATHPDLVASICQIGATTIGPEERARMRERFLVPFNEPAEDGSHLQKTWDYLRHMGLKDSIELRQREVIDHIRAWKGRMLIYSAVWNQDSETLFASVQCPTLVLCAQDDVLWEHMANVNTVKPDADTGIVAGANFSPDLDVQGIVREWDAFQARNATQ
jgi:pimeloyl-ACP methyl ester carboxylesterase